MAKPLDNIIQFPQSKRKNLGYIPLVLLVCYVIYTMFTYVSSGGVTAYEVTQGVIATNNTFKGLILRDESVVYAPYTGNINYYVKSGTKVASEDLVYSIDTKGNVAKKINKATESSQSLDTSELNSLISSVDGFTGSYNGNDFYKVYTFKQDFSSDLSQSLSSNALSDLSETISEASGSASFHQETAGLDGVIAYYVDGLETVTESSFTADMLSSAGYSRKSLQQELTISQGDPVCKIIHSETWNMVIAISADLAEKLNNRSTLNVKFKKDDFTALASISITKKSGQYYLILTLKSGMIRYLGDRYEEIELVLGNSTGLKVPASAIETREFFKIPARCFNGSSAYLLIRDSENATTTHQVTPTIIYNDGENYYVDDTVVTSGDIVQMIDSQETYIVGTDVSELSGVYNINKGYAIFRFIDIMSSNDDYAIVRSGVSRSISLYDRIALDATKVNENKVLK